jgi:hypothetical protein
MTDNYNDLADKFDAATDGAALLSDVKEFIRQFCVFPDEHCLVAVTLWVAHAHMIEHFHTTPRLNLNSPEAGSGKTRVLEVLDLLVPESLFSLNASPAAVFRLLAQKQITLLFDEVDAIWTKRGKDDNREDLRALLNAGYKRGATIPRCVGPRHEVVSFPVYCAVALAGLGDLPDTILSRSIIIRMRRRAPGEQVKPFRSREHQKPGHEFREHLANWARFVGKDVGQAWPGLPPGVTDRPAECWEPLIAVADRAGGPWPQAARDACKALCKVAEDRRGSPGVRLLADLRIIFGDAVAMHTETLVATLVNGTGLDDDAPWANIHGQALGKRGLASLLRPYGVQPVKVTVNGVSKQGYRREHLWDAWERYLPVLQPGSPGCTESPESKTPEGPALQPCPRCDGEGCKYCGDPGIPDVPQFRRAGGDGEEPGRMRRSH